MKIGVFGKGMTRVFVVAALAAACVDSPSAPLAASDPNPLASSLELLADEQAGANDMERSEEFRWAALALRSGVTPSVIEVTNDGRVEVYDGFVHAVTWATLTQSLRPPLHRTLVTWRRSGDVLQVMLVGLAMDSATVLNPLSLRPATPGASLETLVAGAKAAFFERGAVNRTWIGVSGTAKVVEHPQPAACPPPNDSNRPPGVTCQRTRFGIALNVEYAPTRSRDSRELDAQAATRRLIAPQQMTAGVKLLFNCAEPLGTGC